MTDDVALPRSDQKLEQALLSLGARKLAEQRRANLFHFTWGAFNVLHEGRTEFIPNWHVEALCHHLNEVAEKRIRRLLITIPPRHMKTIASSVALPAFLLGQRPATKVIIVTYGDRLSSDILNQLRRLMESRYYRELFPNTIARFSGQEAKTSQNGGILLTSVGGAITGRGADLIIIDDLMKAADADSPTERLRAQEFISNSLMSRFNNRMEGCVVAIQQRLHEDDVAAYLLATGTYQHLNLPAIAEEPCEIAIGQRKFHRRAKGDVLFGQLMPISVLEETKKDLGPQYFAAQYQQNPTPPGGNRMDWRVWHNYIDAPPIDTFHIRIQSWDTGSSALPKSDYSACTTWGKNDDGWWLLDVYRDRLDFGDLVDKALYLRKKWRADRLLIEQQTMGLPLIRELRRRYQFHDNVFALAPITSKEIRFESNIHRLTHEKFWIPETAPWLAEFKHECLAFPKGAHDDMVDSMVQFLYFIQLDKGKAIVERAGSGGFRRLQSVPRRATCTGERSGVEHNGI